LAAAIAIAIPTSTFSQRFVMQNLFCFGKDFGWDQGSGLENEGD
jgi:hypothetical protein